MNKCNFWETFMKAHLLHLWRRLMTPSAAKILFRSRVSIRSGAERI
jgi:hypothetical protein